MLFYNLNYQTKDHIDEASYIPEIIMHPTGVNQATAFHRLRNKTRVTYDRMLLDPQLYFLDLRFRPGTRPEDSCIERLASYSWFGIGPRDWDSGQLRVYPANGEKELSWEEKWEKRTPLTARRWGSIVEEVVAFQVNVDCDGIILPAQLIQDPSSSLKQEFECLREAVAIAIRTNPRKLPIYASLPLADLAFDHSVNPRLVNGLVDGFSSVHGLHGVYVPFVQQTPKASERLANPNAVEGLLRLAKLFGAYTDLKVIFNFVESLGIVCRALGAHGYATGPSVAQRQFTPDNFIEGGGFALPKFFSLSMCADFFPDPEMEWAQKAGQLDAFAADRTEASQDLFKALDKGLAVGGNALDWDASKPNNLVATRRHYFQQQVKALGMVPNAIAALDWLKDATLSYDYLQGECRKVRGGRVKAAASKKDEGVFEKPPIHVPVWRESLENVMREFA